MPEKVVAVVTLYFPDESVLENVSLIAAQVSCAVLSDNTTGTDNSAIFSGMKNVRYFANKKNLGLSASFNARMGLDEVKNSDFLVFFDQDSTVSDGQIKSLSRSFHQLEKVTSVGSLGPMFFDVNRQELMGLYPNSEELVDGCWTVPATITSSLMEEYSKDIVFRLRGHIQMVDSVFRYWDSKNFDKLTRISIAIWAVYFLGSEIPYLDNEKINLLSEDISRLFETQYLAEKQLRSLPNICRKKAHLLKDCSTCVKTRLDLLWETLWWEWYWGGNIVAICFFLEKIITFIQRKIKFSRI